MIDQAIGLQCRLLILLTPILVSLEDPERRIAAQLAWLRMYPKARSRAGEDSVELTKKP